MNEPCPCYFRRDQKPETEWEEGTIHEFIFNSHQGGIYVIVCATCDSKIHCCPCAQVSMSSEHPDAIAEKVVKAKAAKAAKEESDAAKAVKAAAREHEHEHAHGHAHTR